MKGQNPTFAGMSGTAGSYVTYQMNGQTIIRSRPSYTPRRTQKQLRHRDALFTIAAAWRRQTPLQIAAWQRIGTLLPSWDTQKPRGPQPAYNTFLMVGLARMAQNLPLLEDAPVVPTLPAFLATPQAEARFDASRFSLTLRGQEFADSVQVFASRPLPPGRSLKNAAGLVQIAVLPGLSAFGTNIGEAYAARWGACWPGYQIALRLVPLSAAGFAGPPVLVSCVGEG